MITNYITKVKANLTIYANKKTSNVLEGNYKSIYKGKSLNFEDLRNYVIGDNIKDIDWKASARSNSILIRQYVAEKKHNILFVFDSGKKMLADTKENETKKEIGIMTAGTIGYIADKNGDYVGAIYSKENSLEYHPFKSGLYNIEKILTAYEKETSKKNSSNIEQTLQYIIKNIKRKTIIFVITDLEGMMSVQEATLKQIVTHHDLLFVHVSDADLTGDSAFDIEKDLYLPALLLNDKKLQDLEKERKEELYTKCIEKFNRYRVSTITIDCTKEIVKKTIELLERHKHASIR